MENLFDQMKAKFEDGTATEKVRWLTVQQHRAYDGAR